MAFFGGKKKKDPKKQGDGDNDADAIAPEDAKPEFSEVDVNKARKWFQQAKKVYEERNFDYAIEAYLSGLKFWPEAVDEGHIPLRIASYARWEKGGKKPSTLEAMRHPMSGKDAVQAMINAEWLWAHDPHNISYMEGMTKAATKAKCDNALLFIAPIYFEAMKSEKKFNKNRFLLLKKIYEDAAARCERRKEYDVALTFFQGAMTVLEALHNVSGPAADYGKELTSMATKVTILKGKYDSSDSFRSSVSDAKGQKDAHDLERMVVDDERLSELIAEARNDWQENPNVPAKLHKLVEVLVRDEKPEHEDEAIELLDAEYDKTDNYSFKLRADDLRLKQFRREVRNARESGHPDAVKEAKAEQLKFELKIYRERHKKYPTENKRKFEYGRVLMQFKKFDEAIPILQEARNDPKIRFQCMAMIGRCFFEKRYYSQAITQFSQAIKDYELTGDDLSKEMYYWLGRAYMAADKVEEAEQTFGQILQWDYNYRDVRQRLDEIENAK